MDDEIAVKLIAVAERLAGENKEVAPAIVAGMRLVDNLTKDHPDTRPQEILTGIPDADKAMAEAAGVAQIAGVHGVEIEDVMEVAGLLLSLGLAFVA